MEQFQRISQRHGGTSGGFNAGGGAARRPAARTATTATPREEGEVTAGNDSKATEEEIIAEAIVRSLRES